MESFGGQTIVFVPNLPPWPHSPGRQALLAQAPRVACRAAQARTL